MAPAVLGAFSWQMRKLIAVLIDGGHLRVLAKKVARDYSPDLIEKIGLQCRGDDEEIHRILYYDCGPHLGSAKLPVSGLAHTFTGSDKWLHDLARRDLFAVRLGVLKFRGWKPAQVPVNPAELKDSDFDPIFEQKGVDMRIGLDIALFVQTRAVQRIVLLTNDTDCVPALKHARRGGLQVVLAVGPGNDKPANELLSHADYRRNLKWC